MSAIDLTGSAIESITVTASDTVDLPKWPSQGLLVGVSGDVKVTYPNGTVDTLPALAAGVVHPFAVKRIWSTGTTATGLHALYTSEARTA